MEATLTLHQAGNQLGVEDTTLSRLIRVGGLPEARKVNRPEGLVWVIPQEDLPAIARRNGWTIDLRDGAEALLTHEGPDEASPADDAEDPATGEGARSEGALGEGVVGEGAVDESPVDPATHPDLEGWDTSHWNRAAGVETDETILDDVDQDGETQEDIPTEEKAISAAEEVVPASDGSVTPVPGSDRESAIEVSIASPTPVPADSNVPVATGGPDAVQSMVEALDLALLERLLEAQEGRVSAEVLSQENKHALAALNVTHNRATAELEVERRERMMAADRYREERMARAVADAKVAELRDRLVREMALADTEKAARTEALTRSVKAERDAASAVAAMGWRARRRYRKLNAALSDQVVFENQPEGNSNINGNIHISGNDPDNG